MAQSQRAGAKDVCEPAARRFGFSDVGDCQRIPFQVHRSGIFSKTQKALPHLHQKTSSRHLGIYEKGSSTIHEAVMV